MDAMWILPLAAVTGTMIGSDQHTMNDLIHINLNDQHHFNTLSNAGVGSLGALPAGMYLWSLNHYAPQAHETGLLSGEALVDGLAFSEAIDLVIRRDRPNVNDAKGNFFSSSPLNGSFPSNHATAAWALASVLSDEYPGWLMKTAAYGLATTVSVSRVLAEQHFPSDVLVGSAAGWLIGHYVYRAHHDFSLNAFDAKPFPDNFGDPPCNRAANQPRSAHPHSSPSHTAEPQSTGTSDPSQSARTPLSERHRPGHDRFDQRPDGQLDLSSPRTTGRYGIHPRPELRYPSLDPPGVPPPAPARGKFGRTEGRVQSKPARSRSPSYGRPSYRARNDPNTTSR